MVKDAVDKVKEFHSKAEYPINTTLDIDTIRQEKELRKRLLVEEVSEYIHAEDDNDIIEIADSLADMIYIICGTAITYGIPLDKVFDEVHRSNMTKFKHGVIRREDGKILKPDDYEPPKLKEIIYE